MIEQNPLIASTPGSLPPGGADTVALLGRARDGDRLAANELFDRYQERIRRIVRVRLGPNLRRWAESGDLVQDTCRAAFQGIGTLRFDSEFDFLDWLARIASQRIRDFADHVQAQKRDLGRARALEAFEPEESQADASPVDSRSGPWEQAARSEVRELLDEVVGGLSDSYREAILLRDYHGAEWPDVARALATPTIHAAQQLHQRAWIKVRLAIGPRLGDGERSAE